MNTRKKGITRIEFDVYCEMQRMAKLNGYIPSYEEIGRQMNLTKGTICQHIKGLMEKGYIERINNKKRAIKFLK